MARPNITGKKREQIFLKSHGECVDCGVVCSGGWQVYKTKPLVRQFELMGTHEIHHVLPIHKGGGEEIDNLILLCRSCHKARHSLDRSK